MRDQPQPKKWDYNFTLERGKEKIGIDARDWSFVLLEYPDNAKEVLLSSNGKLPPLTKDERQIAASIVLESVLGEELLLEKIEHFELVDHFDEAKHAKLARPLVKLREAVGF